MNNIIAEFLFWIIFLFLNYLNYVIVYVLHRKESYFLPHVKSIIENKKLGLTSEVNLDFFRYSVELSVILFISRIYNISEYSIVFTLFYYFFFIFNIYQISFRKIYEAEPILFNDLKLLKNGFAIVWNESKVKFLIFIAGLLFLILGSNSLFKAFLNFNSSLSTSLFFCFVAVVFIIISLYLIFKKKGFIVRYPNEIYLRFHFVLAEFIMNLIKSHNSFVITKEKYGIKFSEGRKNIKIKPVDVPPNIHLFFIESYGSFAYKEKKIAFNSYRSLETIQNNIRANGFSTVSNLSKSTTTGGQSWLHYTSVLFGLKIDNNTLFESLLKDEEFRKSKGLLQLFKEMGYTNYNLNPISPINGISVPYDEMRELYQIDKWLLNEDIYYIGDKYGFGLSAPDQYNMNFTMELIKKENNYPYTFFYLTKNSHSPFPKIELVENWKSLNSKKGKIHRHQGFLKYPAVEDYGESIEYQLENMERFILDHGTSNDIYILMGDHQPPVISKPEIHGLTTPVHIISKNKAFLEEFKKHGFEEEFNLECNPITHESFYSIFLRAYANHFSKYSSNIPEYEPAGFQL